MTEAIIFNAESAHRKTISLQDKQRKFEHKTKLNFKETDQKIDSYGKRAKENLDRVRGELRRETTKNEE